MKEFPFIRGEEKNTLFIIGNGFDLYHRALTRYKHFCCWLNLNGYEDFVLEMHKIFPNLDNEIETLWSNFEEALGKYKLDKVYERYYKSPNYSMYGKEWEIEANKVVDKVSEICVQIRPLMRRWVEQINIEQISPQMELSKNSWYLTFNYTTILERIYRIPLNHICHIHGCVDKKGELITGHDNIKGINIYGAKSDEEENAKIRIVEIINNLAKDKKKQIEANKIFFHSLSAVKHIVVLGHSMADIDLGYFGKVISSVDQDAIWHFSIYSEEDRKRIEIFKKNCSLFELPINEGKEVDLKTT